MDLLKKTHTLLLFLLTLLLTGCYEDFDPKIDTTPVLCLNSLITAGEPIDVRVSRTWIYTDKDGYDNRQVSDATVSIFANGSKVDSGYLPAEGDRIRIHACSPTYGEAEAEVTVPVAMEISGSDYSCTVTDMSESRHPVAGIMADIRFDIRMSIDLQDHGETADFHRLTYETFHKGGGIYTKTRNAFRANLSGGNFDPLDPVFYQQVDPFEDVMNGSYHTMFFSDRLYNGEVKPLTFGFSNCSFYISNWDGDPADLACGWTVTLFSISESYYNWLAYSDKESGIVFGDFADVGLAEPIWAYSNVSTGAGVVAAQSSTTVTFDLRDFLEEALLRNKAWSPRAPRQQAVTMARQGAKHID